MFDVRCFVIVFVFFTTQSGFAQLTYEKVGGSVVLHSGFTSGDITSVTWKHQKDLALEWFKMEITCYRTFNGRCNLDKSTGSFTITNLTLEDSGEYTPEINSLVLGKKELKVIKPVPKPTVTKDCNKEKTNCTLICEPQLSPAEFGPVTYEWKSGEKKLSNYKVLSLTTKNEESSFFCKLTNPVSHSASDEVPTPFSKEDNSAGVIVGVVITIVFLGLVAAAFVMYKKGVVQRLRQRGDKRRVRSDPQTIPELNENLLAKDEIKSKGKEELNGDLHANMHKDGINDSNQIVVLMETQEIPASEPNSNNKVEPGQNSKSQETEPTAEGPEELKEDLPAKDEINDANHTAISIESQENPASEPNSNDKVEPGQNSKSQETEPTADEPEKPKESTCDPPVATQPEQGPSQESNLDPSAASPQPNSQTELKEDLPAKDEINDANHTAVSIESQENPASEPNSNDKVEPGQNSKSQETEPTAEEPEKPKESTCDPPVATQPEQGSSQESNLDASPANPDPNSQTETPSTETCHQNEGTPDTDSAES